VAMDLFSLCNHSHKSPKSSGFLAIVEVVVQRAPQQPLAADTDGVVYLARGQPVAGYPELVDCCEVALI